MGSVRSRLEAELRAKQDAAPDFVPRASRSSLVVGNPPTRSTRQHETQRQDEAHPEVLTPPRTAGATTGVLVNPAPLSTRERSERQAALARVTAEQPPTSDTGISAWEEYWLSRKREAEAEEQERQRKQAERIAQEKADQKAAAEKALWMIGVTQMFDTLGATPAERARVLRLPSVAVGMDADKVGGILLTLRDATRGKPAWAETL